MTSIYNQKSENIPLYTWLYCRACEAMLQFKTHIFILLITANNTGDGDFIVPFKLLEEQRPLTALLKTRIVHKYSFHWQGM